MLRLAQSIASRGCTSNVTRSHPGWTFCVTRLRSPYSGNGNVTALRPLTSWSLAKTYRNFDLILSLSR